MTANLNADFEQSARSASSISGAIGSRSEQPARAAASEPRIADLARFAKIAVRDVISRIDLGACHHQLQLRLAAMIFRTAQRPSRRRRADVADEAGLTRFSSR